MVMPKLTEQFSWEEIVQRIMEKSNKSSPQFKKWLSGKEKFGYFFDPFLHARAFNIWKALNEEDRDHFVVICGKEGSGKSTLAIQLASLIDPTFNLNRICFKMDEYVNRLSDAKKGEAYILDEGNMFLFSRESYSEDSRFMIKLFALMRQKNLLTIICVPNFFTIDSYVRDHRADTVLYVHKRGKYVAYVKSAIRIISRDGYKNKSMMANNVYPGTYWPGNFNKGFPQLNGIAEETYRKYKDNHFNEFLEDIKQIVQIRSKQSILMNIKEAQAILPMDERSYVAMVKEGNLKGKRIRQKYFIDRADLLALAKL